MSENNANENDALLAKAEARRRRILENSKARLEKIAVKKQDGDDDGKSLPKNRIIYPDPEVERVEYEFRNFSPYNNDLNTSPQSMFEILNRMQQTSGNSGGGGGFGANLFGGTTNLNGLSGDEAAAQLFGASFHQLGNGGGGSGGGVTGGPTNRPPKLPDSRFIKLLKTKLHISALALITYLLIATNLMFTSNVFLIFLLWEMAEVFLLKTYETNQPSFLGILFMLSGIPAIHSTIIIKLFETFNKILKDVAIFVFFFVISHLLYHACWLNDLESLSLIIEDDPSLVL